ncbi:MAG TPA: YceI family protein [Hyphomonadaceae bacterium]|nr:YceI family protein [Hyphomonadaceae bacterium]
MRNLMLAVALATLSTPAFAQAPAGTYAVDKPHASITWKGLHQGLSWYVARFTNFDITVDFNEADVSKSKVTASVDLKSVETDYARTRPASSNTDFNSELGGERFLNSAKFPQATFTSTAITKTGDKTGKMTGNLTFMGVSRPVTFDVTYIGNRNDPRSQKHKIGFQAVGAFKRSDFGVAVGGPVGDEIRLEINAELIQK